MTSTTGYAFAAIFYLIFCFGMSRYARFVEARLARGRQALRDTMAQQTAANPQLKPAPLKTDVAVEMIGVHKWYGEFHVLRDINLARHHGERIVICGPSGSGKSTMIRCINRLEEHQKGQHRRRRHRARPTT